MTCAALILAAGASTRLGVPKQLAHLDNEALLDRSIRIAREAGFAPIVVVLGAFEDRIRTQCDLRNVLTVSNPDWAEGMGSSLSLGVQALLDQAGLLVMTCDMPAVHGSHLRALAASGVLTASSYAGRRGVPAYFPNDVFPELLRLKGDEGARELLRSASAVDLPGGELDIDTAEDLARVQGFFPVSLHPAEIIEP